MDIWPIDVLTKGDVYVVNGYGKVKDGTLIGSSLGNAIHRKTGKGVILYGSIRNMQELKDIKSFNARVKGHDPFYFKDMTPASFNAPICIGEITVFPGDVVFAKREGVLFIPAHLANRMINTAGQIDSQWNDALKKTTF